jgi:hypothetical protein
VEEKEAAPRCDLEAQIRTAESAGPFKQNPKTCSFSGCHEQAAERFGQPMNLLLSRL